MAQARPSPCNRLCFIPFFFLLLIGVSVGRPLYPLPSKTSDGSRQPMQTFRPYNIAHRGSNGELPEETSPAYMRAIEEGADFIETDILATKDGSLICFHDVYLDDTTDVSHHKEFAGRRRTYEVQGVNITGWFTVDFTLKEIKSLRVKQRFKFREQSFNGHFPIITFEEYISIALDAPRVVGIYPEIKNPIFINEHVKWADGKKFEDKFVETLLKYGYKGAYLSKDWVKQPIFIQSFAPTSLVYISNLTDSPKIFLIDDVTVPTQDTNQSYWEITSSKYFEYIKDYVVGIGPSKDTLVLSVKNHLTTISDLVAKAHAHNLQVHPYIFRNEYMYLHFDFHQDPYAEYDYWINNIGVDGLFTDFTGSFHKFQEWTSVSESDDKSATNLLHKIGLMLSSYKGVPLVTAGLLYLGSSMPVPIASVSTCGGTNYLKETDAIYSLPQHQTRLLCFQFFHLRQIIGMEEFEEGKEKEDTTDTIMGYLDVISHAWNVCVHGDPMRLVHNKSERVKSSLREWSKNLKENLLMKSNEASAKLKHIQDEIHRYPSNMNLIEEENRALDCRARELNFQECSLKQKSRILLLSDGDRNFRFFHASMKASVASNYIWETQGSDGKIINQDDKIGLEVVSYFENLLGIELGTVEPVHISYIRRFSTNHNVQIGSPILRKEVDIVPKQVNPNKASGPDGLNFKFYQST